MYLVFSFWMFWWCSLGSSCIANTQWEGMTAADVLFRKRTEVVAVLSWIIVILKKKKKNPITSSIWLPSLILSLWSFGDHDTTLFHRKCSKGKRDFVHLNGWGSKACKALSLCLMSVLLTLSVTPKQVRKACGRISVSPLLLWRLLPPNIPQSYIEDIFL